MDRGTIRWIRMKTTAMMVDNDNNDIGNSGGNRSQCVKTWN